MERFRLLNGLTRWFAAAGSLMLCLSLIVSCSSGDRGGGILDGDSSRDNAVPSVVLSTTEVVKGKNRLTFGIFRSPTDQVKNAVVNIVMEREGEEQKAVSFKYVGDLYADKGLYVGEVELPETGTWTALVNVDENGSRFSAKIPFEVLSESLTPAIGSKAPATKNLLPSSGDSDVYYCSATPPCTMHDHEIAENLNKAQPLLILFGSPGRCVSELCGPQLAVTEKLKGEFGDRVSFIHVEIFSDGETEEVVQAAYDWGLPTEPWTFLVDENGLITDKFEGPALEVELRAGLENITEGAVQSGS